MDTVTAVRRQRGTANIVGKRGTTADAPPDEDETFDPLAPPTAEELARLNAPAPPPPRDESRRRVSGHHWRLAIITGLVASWPPPRWSRC